MNDTPPSRFAADEKPPEKYRNGNGEAHLPLNAQGKKTHAQELFDQMMQMAKVDEAKAEAQKINKKIVGVVVCVTCGKRFSSQIGLDGHLTKYGIYHNNKCPKCPGVKFNSWAEHQSHQQQI